MSQAVDTQPGLVETRPVKGRLSLERSQIRLAWLMLLPTLAVVAFVAIWPLIQTIWLSFTDKNFLSTEPEKFVGLKNYGDLLKDSQFFHSIWVTVQFTLITIVFEFLLGMIIALVINSNFKGRGLMRTAMLIPWAIPTVVSALMWKWMYNDISGVVTDLLVNKLHIFPPGTSLIANAGTALPAIAAVDIWKTTPFVALLLLAGLQVIPTDVYEAARMDGANPIQQFFQITLPLLMPAILVTLIFRTLDALRVFDVFYVMFENRSDTQTMATYAQLNIVNFAQGGYGGAISVAIFLIIAIFVGAYVTFLKVEQT